MRYLSYEDPQRTFQEFCTGHCTLLGNMNEKMFPVRVQKGLRLRFSIGIECLQSYKKSGLTRERETTGCRPPGGFD